MRERKEISICILTVLSLVSPVVLGQKLLKRNIFFESGLYLISSKNKSELDSLIKRIQDKDYQIVLIGHADSISSEEFNMNLSRKRTEHVADYLAINGINRSKITDKFSGELNPLFSNATIDKRARNRCVEIIIQLKAEESVPVAINPRFEKDTTVYCKNGAQIIFNAGAFYPRKITDINFNIKEVYSNCEILKSNWTMETEDGNCLSSAGMIYIKPTIDTIEIQPNKGQLVTIKLPMISGTPDPDMKIYFAATGKSGGTVWKEESYNLSYEDKGNRFYVFQVDSLTAINIDKSLGIVCQKNGPRIKIRKFNTYEVCQTYPNELYLSRGKKIKRGTFVIDKVINDKKPELTIMAFDKDGLPYIAKGPLLGLKHRKRKNTYIVSSKYFQRVPIDYSGKMTPTDYLCNYVSN
jgi:hypothetical protein